VKTTGEMNVALNGGLAGNQGVKMAGGTAGFLLFLASISVLR